MKKTVTINGRPCNDKLIDLIQTMLERMDDVPSGYRASYNDVADYLNEVGFLSLTDEEQRLMTIRFLDDKKKSEAQEEMEYLTLMDEYVREHEALVKLARSFYKHYGGERLVQRPRSRFVYYG